MVIQYSSSFFKYKLSRLSHAMWQKSVIFSSLCYVKFTDNSFVEYFVHILSKVSEAKKTGKRAKEAKKDGYKKNN